MFSPTHVGMVRRHEPRPRRWPRSVLPHARGDGPFGPGRELPTKVAGVLPTVRGDACGGRWDRRRRGPAFSPQRRGDGPLMESAIAVAARCSPHVRGDGPQGPPSSSGGKVGVRPSFWKNGGRSVSEEGRCQEGRSVSDLHFEEGRCQTFILGKEGLTPTFLSKD